VVTVDHERAVAVIDVSATVQTPAHTVVTSSCAGPKAVLRSACRNPDDD
jgi:hypothetical protein